MDDEKLELLRLEALKSATKKARQISSSNDEDETDSLRTLALKSCKNEDRSLSTIIKKGEKKAETIANIQTPAKTSVEELHLRERALKSLLKKRVVKTESIIKVCLYNIILFFK